MRSRTNRWFLVALGLVAAAALASRDPRDAGTGRSALTPGLRRSIAS